MNSSLHVKGFNVRGAIEALDCWLCCFSEKTVKVLVLRYQALSVPNKCLLRRFHDATILTVLKLENLQLEAIDFRVSFPSLKSLYLVYVRAMDDQILLHSILL